MKKNNRKQRQIAIILLLLLCIMCFRPSPAAEKKQGITIPGNVSRLCYFSDFFYNFPSGDFLYYLNDRLLYWEKPDEKVMANGLRHRILELLSWHKAIKDLIYEFTGNTGDKKNTIVFNLADDVAFGKAQKLMLLLGHQLKKNDIGQYYLTPIISGEVPDYLRFSLIDPSKLVNQLNKTHYFNFQLMESNIPINGNMDLGFIREITGMPVDQSTFFETLVRDERFSLLMAVLYRLSDREIRYINRLIRSPRFGAWKKIYNDKKLLMGLFMLTNALRVKKIDGRLRLQLPGGDAAEAFWTKMIGDDIMPGSFEFLQGLATADDGKLNALYVFSFFLPEDTREALFFHYDAAKVKDIYNRIQLREEEKLSDSMFPVVGDWSYFTLMNGLETRDGELLLPLGADAWLKAVNGDPSPPAPVSGETPDSGASVSQLLAALAGASGNGNGGKKMNAIRKFLAIYSKFSHRPELLAGGNLFKLYQGYEDYNAVVDVIEKIPLRSPATVSRLLDWVHNLERLGGKERELFTVIYQSLFEILAFTGKYAPDRFDYDALVSGLTELPLSRSRFYSSLFEFLTSRLGIEKNKTLTDVMMTGIPDPTVKIGSESVKYKFMINQGFRKTIARVIQAQEICTFSQLMEINRLLASGLNVKPPATAEIGTRITEAFRLLPHPGMGSGAPRKVRARITPYSQSRMNKSVKHFVESIHMGADPARLKTYVSELQGDYLIHHLKDHLLALTYAIDARDGRIRAFINPNFVRLHDIEGLEARTLWDNFSNGKPSKKKEDMFAEYHLSGPLSRLNIGFAARWQAYLFRGNILHNSDHVQALITNLLEYYPYPLVNHGQAYNALLVDLGLELLREARDNESDTIKKQVTGILGTVTAGYHYRRVMEYLDGKSSGHNLYLSEVKKLGEAFFQSRQPLPAVRELEAYRKPPLAGSLVNERRHFGGIYAHTFGNLVPRHIPLFPQEIGNLMASGWLSGAMVDEFKIKLWYHLYKKQVPPCLLGQILYMYLNKTAKQFLRQNHQNDYPISYFIFDIFNNAHLKRSIKQLKKEGYLKLQ